MRRLLINAPAKLNLVLDCLKKRSDGFHELKTIFERISLSDRIELESNNSGKITIQCSRPGVPLGHRNLAYKAAELLKNKFSIRGGIHIHIIKNIPVAAGLAGGSSNGAAVLLGLNRLWSLNLDKKQLIDFAKVLGSDVPFFIYEKSFAIGTGRGDIIQPLDIKTKLWHLVVTPRLTMYTKEVFSRLKLKLTNKKDNVNILLPFLCHGDIKHLAGALSNDLEPVIVSLVPGLLDLKKKLIDAGAVGVCFSGSGPSVFALAESQKHALSLREKFDRRYSQIFVVSTL